MKEFVEAAKRLARLIEVNFDDWFTDDSDSARYEEEGIRGDIRTVLDYAETEIDKGEWEVNFYGIYPNTHSTTIFTGRKEEAESLYKNKWLDVFAAHNEEVFRQASTDDAMLYSWIENYTYDYNECGLMDEYIIYELLEK